MITLANIQTGDTARLRMGRAGRTGVVWGPWEEREVYVERRASPLPRRTRRPVRSHEVGAIITLTVVDGDTADFSIDDFHDGVFTAEDYYLQLDIPVE